MIKEYSDIINCPFCKHQQGVYLNLDIQVQKIICENPNCKKEFEVPMKFKKIFLSRTFECSDSKYKYPIYIRKMYDGIIESIDLLEILKKSNPKTYYKMENIPEINKKWIDFSDIYVGYIFEISFGTLWEMYYAKSKPIPIYVINPNRMWMNDIWLKYMANKIFDNTDDCFHHIINEIIYDYNKI